MKEKQIGDSCKCNDCGEDFIYTADMINRRGDTPQSTVNKRRSQ